MGGKKNESRTLAVVLSGVLCFLVASTLQFSITMYVIRSRCWSEYIEHFVYFQRYDLVGFAIGTILAWFLTRSSPLGLGKAVIFGALLSLLIAIGSWLDDKFGTAEPISDILQPFLIIPGILYGAAVGVLFHGALNLLLHWTTPRVSSSSLRVPPLAIASICVAILGMLYPIWLRSLAFAYSFGC